MSITASIGAAWPPEHVPMAPRIVDYPREANLAVTGSDVAWSTCNRSLSDIPATLGVVAQNLTSLWAWGSPANGWYFYAPGLDAKGGTALTDYVTGKGYRDFTQHNKTLGNGTGFWGRRP